jgi:hypothetical protein
MDLKLRSPSLEERQLKEDTERPLFKVSLLFLYYIYYTLYFTIRISILLRKKIHIHLGWTLGVGKKPGDRSPRSGPTFPYRTGIFWMLTILLTYLYQTLPS